MNETRERFLKAILEYVPAERVVEIHFFPPIRQGQIETGVAVVAVEAVVKAEVAANAEAVADDDAIVAPTSDAGPLEPSAPDQNRLEVHTASYRWTRKGPERGKWSVDVKPEADAPFATVDLVVRGVQERAGEALDAERLTGAELRALSTDPAWRQAS